MLLVDPADRVIGQVMFQMIGGIGWRLHMRGIFDQIGFGHAAVGPQEAVEIFETQARGPAIERSGAAHFPFRGDMPLADHRRIIAVFLQDLGHGAGAFGDQAVIAVIACRPVGDIAHADRLRIAPGQQRGAGRRTDGDGVELVITQSGLRERVEGRRGDRAAKGAAGTKADIVGHDDQDIGSPVGGADWLRPAGRRGFRRRAAIDFRGRSIGGLGDGRR